MRVFVCVRVCLCVCDFMCVYLCTHRTSAQSAFSPTRKIYDLQMSLVNIRKSPLVLQCVAVCCTCVAASCHIGKHSQKSARVAVCCSVLQCVAVCCTCVAARCHIGKYSQKSARVAVCCSVLHLCCSQMSQANILKSPLETYVM